MKFLPDWSPEAIEKIGMMLTKDMTVYEWGSGRSTIWLAERVKKVYSMEHDIGWFDLVKRWTLENTIINIDQKCYSLDDIRYYTSIRLIEEDLDFIFVDGRNRVSCFLYAGTQAKENTNIVLDDSERARYAGVWLLPIKIIAEYGTEQKTAVCRKKS